MTGTLLTGNGRELGSQFGRYLGQAVVSQSDCLKVHSLHEEEQVSGNFRRSHESSLSSWVDFASSQCWATLAACSAMG